MYVFMHCVHALSVECILHQSRMAQLHMTYSVMCNKVWFRQDNPTRCPDGVPVIVDMILLVISFFY